MEWLGNAYQFQIASLSTIVGCSRLRCEVCGVDVVDIGGLELAPGISPGEAYWARSASPAPHHVTSSTPATRLYCCKCSSWLETGHTATQPPPSHDVLASAFRWSCRGHDQLQHHTEGVDQLDEAHALLGAEPSSAAPRSRNTDILKIMWCAASDSLRAELRELIVEQLARATGMPLARALAVTEVEPAAFGRALAALDPEDPRLQVDDPTRTGWSLRDRLASSLAAYIVATSDWNSVEDAARALLPGTASKALITACIQMDPEAVADAFVTRSRSPALARARSLEHWHVVLERVLADDRIDDAHAAIEAAIGAEPDPVAARVAIYRTLDITLSAWRFSKPMQQTMRLLQLVEAYRPPRGFSRTIELFDHLPTADVRAAALRALRGYYRAPPLHPEPQFESYVKLLVKHQNAPDWMEDAWENLMALDRLDLDATVHAIVSDPHRMNALIGTCLRTPHRRQAEETLSALYNACLTASSAEGVADAQFRASVEAHGCKILDQTDASLKIHYGGDTADPVLTIKPDNVTTYWSLQYQRESAEAAPLASSAPVSDFEE